MFNFNSSTKRDIASEEADYDSRAKYYCSNLINSIILFAITTDELEKLTGPAFDPIFELESEIDYAFTPVLFETIFRNKLIDVALRSELLVFKEMTDSIPEDIWDWQFIDNHPIWLAVRERANLLLNKLCVDTRKYCDDYTTVYLSDGTLVKQGKDTYL